jgi:uncharacterized repeat protein (TIGR02543 family)
MPKVFIRKSSTWPEIKSIFVKKTTGWAEVKNVFLKKLVSGVATWVKVYTKLSLPDTTTAPSIRTTNTSGVGDQYDGPAAESPRFLNDNLFGKDGVYTNFTSKFGRKFTKADAAAALPAQRSTVVTGDLFTSGGGVTTSDRTGLDGKYLFFELTVQNGSSANEIQSVSSPIKMIKRAPATTDFQWTQVEQVGTQLVLNYVYENYYYNSISPGSSYIKWWRNTTDEPGGTLIKSETITDTTTGTPNTTSRSGTSYYTPTVDDIGYYVVAETTAVNSNTIHFAYTDNYTVASWSTTEPIAAALSIIDVNFTDSNDRSGKNARGNLVTATSTTLNWKVTGISPSTTYRVRYRVLNNQNGLYYNPFSATQLAASAAWEVFEDNYNGTGNISSVSISGSTATLYDVFTINETFNGSTYGGGLSRYSFEYELSVVSASGVRRYWVYPESMSSSQDHDYWDIDPTTDPSISATPNPAGTGATVTFSGTFNSYPASLNSYPHSYRIVYGTSPATDSGWIELGSGTANQTYTNTKVYSDTGTYYPYIETTPSYTTNSVTLTVSNAKSPPTMGTPTISAVGAFVTGQRRLSVPFTAVTNSGPAYQIYWYPGENYLGNAKPPVTASIDGSGTTSPIRDESGPNGIGRYAVWIRSSATTSTTGSTAPSTTLSDWSDLQYVYISGTRTLSYNKNTTDTVGSLPSDSSGTDPWDGWVTTVSSNTPTRTGYTFNGYNTSSDGTSGTNYAAGAAITLTSAVTLYAKWTANTYAINYYGNGNTGGSVPDSQTKTHGVDITLRTNVNTLTKTNNVFNGWNTNTSGTGTSYASGATYTGNSALDLYAKWAALYTITFNSKGGTAVSSIEQSSAGGSISQPTNPTKTDNSFGGWSTTDGGTTAVTWPRTPTGNETLYAIWTATATVPSAPTSPSMGASTLTRSLTTSLTRNSNTQKDQYWSGDVKADFTMTWTAGTGATSHEVFYNDTGTAPASTDAADYDDLATSKSDYWYYSDTATTYHYWVRARNDNGTSAWVKIGTKTIPALSVTGYAIRIYRGNGTSFGTPANANAFSDGFYAWTVTSRGNPSVGGEGHYAYIQATLNGGTGLTATSLTV